MARASNQEMIEQMGYFKIIKDGDESSQLVVSRYVFTHWKTGSLYLRIYAGLNPGCKVRFMRKTSDGDLVVIPKKETHDFVAFREKVDYLMITSPATL